MATQWNPKGKDNRIIKKNQSVDPNNPFFRSDTPPFTSGGGGTSNAPKRTPEEVTQAKKQGNEYIQEREKRASYLMRQGLSNKAAVKEASRQITEEIEAGVSTLGQKQATAAQAQAQAQFLEQGRQQIETAAAEGAIPPAEAEGGFIPSSIISEKEKDITANMMATAVTTAGLLFLTKGIGSGTSASRGTGSAIKSLIFGGGGYTLGRISGQSDKILGDVSTQANDKASYYKKLVEQVEAGTFRGKEAEAITLAAEMERSLNQLYSDTKLMSNNWFPMFNEGGKEVLEQLESERRDFAVYREQLLNSIAASRAQNVYNQRI